MLDLSVWPGEMLWAKHTGQREMGKGRGLDPGAFEEEVKARSDRKPEQ